MWIRPSRPQTVVRQLDRLARLAAAGRVPVGAYGKARALVLRGWDADAAVADLAALDMVQTRRVT